MIPSRGLRWSTQHIAIGRRRIESLAARQFSSSTAQNGPIRGNPLLSPTGVPIARLYPKTNFSKTNLLIRNGVAVRFASTTPSSAVASTSVAPITTAVPISEAASSSKISDPLVSSLNSATELSTAQLTNSGEYIGYLKSLGLDYGYGPTAMMEWVIEHIHVYSGAPWWATIAISAVAVRLLLLKPFINAAENNARMMTIMPITKPITKEMTEAQRQGDSTRMLELRQELQRINKRAGVSLMKSFVAPFLNFIPSIGTFFLLRGMSALPVPSLQTGGLYWFTNLAIPDPYFILPVVTAGVLHLVLRKGGETGSGATNPTMLKMMMYGMPALSLAFTAWFPASVQLSFLITGLISWGQVFMFGHPTIRKMVGLTPLPKAPTAPLPYPGSMKTATGPLSQAELNSRFESSTSKPGLITNMKGKLTDIKESAKKTKEGAQEYMGRSNEKKERENAEKYDERRQKEIRLERERQAERERERVREKRQKRARRNVK